MSSSILAFTTPGGPIWLTASSTLAGDTDIITNESTPSGMGISFLVSSGG